MASARLVLSYKDSNNGDITMSYSHANASATTADVKALTLGIIENGSIFEKVPVTAKEAKIVVTTETVYNLGD